MKKKTQPNDDKRTHSAHVNWIDSWTSSEAISGKELRDIRFLEANMCVRTHANEVIENVRQSVLKKLQFQGPKSKLSSYTITQFLYSLFTLCSSSRALISQLGFVSFCCYCHIESPQQCFKIYYLMHKYAVHRNFERRHDSTRLPSFN